MLFNKFHKLLCQINNVAGTGFLGQMPNDIRSIFYTFWLRKAGATIGPNSRVHFRVSVWHPENISIGRNVKVPASTDMAGMGNIEIGDDVLIGARVSFITNHHPIESETLTREEVLRGQQQSIKVGNEAWIMNGVTLIAGRSGLIVGRKAQLAACAVVTKNVPAGELWGGVPARAIDRACNRSSQLL